MLNVNRLRRLLHPDGPDDSAAPGKKLKLADAIQGRVRRENEAKAEAEDEKKPTEEGNPATAMAAKKKRHRRKLSQKRLADAAAARAASAAEKGGGGGGGKSGIKKSASLVAGCGDQLLASKFRFLNEQLYTLSSSDAYEMFQADPSAFQAYHAGYESQRAKWTEDPIDWVAAQCRQRLPADGSGVLVDFGCGDARLALRLAGACRRVHSLDLVAVNSRVTACDMARSPLPDRCAHAAVFCLSLMNANLSDFLAEASRVLRLRGLLCIVEARSRVERTQRFVNLVERFGFKAADGSAAGERKEDKYLVYALFSKTRHRARGEPLPEIRLKPCLYKKR